MITPHAVVSRSTGAYNVYSEPERINKIGLIYPGECFTIDGFDETRPVHAIYFRDSSGTPRRGYVHTDIRVANYQLWKVSNGSLVENPRTSDGYYIHTIRSGYDMNWYIGSTKQASPLPAGTLLYFSGWSDSYLVAGERYPYRICFNGYKKPGGSFVKKDFFIDYLTLGSLVSNRVIL